jgi:hypothetical protein
MSAGRIQQQDITTFAQAAAEAQRGDRPRRQGRSGRRGRMPLCLSRLAWAGSSEPHDPGSRKVVLSFHDAVGPQDLAGRALIVTLTYAEISQALGAVPAESVPKNVATALHDVRVWLENGGS